jgi:hypothetical protein
VFRNAQCAGQARRRRPLRQVIEPTKRIRGTVNYAASRMVSDDRGTYVVIPLKGEQGRNYLLIWSVLGEISKYLGIHVDPGPNRGQGQLPGDRTAPIFEPGGDT